jgi:hypothetical protein
MEQSSLKHAVGIYFSTKTVCLYLWLRVVVLVVRWGKSGPGRPAGEMVCL